MGSNFFNPLSFAKSSNYGFDPMGAIIASSPTGVQNFIGKESHFDPLINSKFGADVTPENYALAQKYQQSQKYPTTAAPADPAASLAGAQAYYGTQGNAAPGTNLNTTTPGPAQAIAAAPRQTVDPNTSRLIWGSQGPQGGQQQSAW